jgi:hypothetical protein
MISRDNKVQFGPTENGPIAMTRQSLSCLTQLAALGASPGRLATPIAIAFHPLDASMSLRDTSSLTSAAMVELPAGRATGDV